LGFCHPKIAGAIRKKKKKNGLTGARPTAGETQAVGLDGRPALPLHQLTSSSFSSFFFSSFSAFSFLSNENQLWLVYIFLVQFFFFMVR
jgi:hypothetical protein